MNFEFKPSFDRSVKGLYFIGKMIQSNLSLLEHMTKLRDF